MNNKQDTGYHLDFFRPPTLLKMLVRMMKALVFGKKSSDFLTSRNQNVSDFLQNFILCGKKSFNKKNVI